MSANTFRGISLKKIFLLLFIFLLAGTTKGNGRDSLFVTQYNQTIYYNSDTIFSNYVEKGFEKAIDDLYEYYEDVFFHLSDEGKKTELAKMRDMAKTMKSKSLENEVVLLENLCLPENNEEQILHKAEKLKSLIKESARNSNLLIEIRSMEALFDLHWRSMNYAKAFHQIHLLEKRLQDISDDVCMCRGQVYFRIGEAYYFFRDYEKAIPYLRKAIGPAQHYCDRANLNALNLIGSYFNLKGESDSAQYYFRQAYNSYDKVKSRSVFDAMSLSNLGHTFVKKGDYDEAIPYYRAGLAYILINSDYERASDVTLGLANCYLAKGDTRKTKQLIDSTLLFINRSGNVNLNRALYPLMSKYYAKTGNIRQAEAFLDSAVIVNERYLEKYNNLHVLRAEQEVFEAESAAKDDELKYQQEKFNDRLIYGGVIISLIFTAFVVMVILYRRNKKAYRALVQKNQIWAETEAVYAANAGNSNTSKENSNEPDEEDKKLMQQVYELIKQEKIFKDLDLTLDSLSKRMNVNRNYLSKAINKTTGKNFNAYINEYRIKEAIKIMSGEKSNLLSIDAIALEVGFGNRTSFYQSFKKITGLSPSDFRNNKVNKKEDTDFDE